MATSTTVVKLPPPTQIAQAVAEIEPAELSKAPLLGILGVIIGAGTVTLTSRMISFGLADLRGHLGLSFDDAAWIGAAFDMALIFIGPLTVFLGGLMGPRNILFFAATMFTVTCTFLPFIHNYSLLSSAIVLALLLEAGVKSDRVVADAHAQPLNSPEDFWTIAMGARFRGTIQELDLEAHERVREATTEYISRHNVRSVETNAVFAIATKP